MAKIDIDKFICDYYEEKKKKLPYDVRSSKLDMIERLLRSQNLEIHCGELKEINAVKPKFKKGQYVIYKNEYFYIYNVENEYYFLIGTGEITDVELPFKHEDELTLVHDVCEPTFAPIGKDIVLTDGYVGLLNELYMDFPKIPFSDMLRIVLRTQEYVESQSKPELPKWRKAYNNSTWSGEIRVSPTERLFRYENYTIDADELFNKLEKE